MNGKIMLKQFIIVLLFLFFLVGCTNSDNVPLSLNNPFIGGDTGLSVEFQGLRDVFDGGRDPFDIVIKLNNKGETSVPKDKVKVRLSGFNPAEFGKLEEQLSKSADEELIAMKKDAQGNIQVGNPIFVDFKDLNHFSPIVGSSQSVDIVANICYNYKTLGVGKLCVRSNILNPEPGGICEINSNKDLFNSGAPVQFGNLVESIGGKDKISFIFDVRKVGAGYVFEMDSKCDRSTKSKENKVYVKVDTNLPGVVCSGLTSKGSSAEGFVTLFDDAGVLKRQISCNQQISSKNNFEQVISLSAGYEYDDFIKSQITVKSTGEN